MSHGIDDRLAEATALLTDRRTFLAGAAALGSAFVLGGTASAQEGDGQRDVSDIDVLNYALTLEHLEATYYTEALEQYSEKDFEGFGSPGMETFSGGRPRYGTYQNYENVRDHEIAHVHQLTAAVEDLGGTPVEAAEYEFPYSSIEEFIALSATIENVGVSAYAGAAPLIDSPDLLAAALSIHSVEARHATYLDLQRNGGAPPFRGASGAFDPARSMEEVLDIAGQFVVGRNGGDSSHPQSFIESATALDVENQTVTLPLFRGMHDGSPVHYIVTESSDANHADRYGLNHAPKLANALDTDAVQDATVIDGSVDFPGTVDFSPTREVEPGPNAFPLDVAHPGATGDDEYSPLVTTGDGIVMNASQIENESGVHDSVVDVNLEAMTVTLSLLAGFYEGERIQYLGMDSSSPVVATLEQSTLALPLDAAPGLASNAETSARSAIAPIVNGPTGANNPERQGLRSAVRGEGDPLNVTQTEPGETDYSPIWDVHLVVWTDDSIAEGERKRLTDTADVATAFERGTVVSGGSGPANSSLDGLQAAEFVSNCPIVVNLDADQE